MTFLEKDLEQIIYESGRDLLNEKGLFIDGKLYRQFKIGNYGIADLVSISMPTYYGEKKQRLHKGIITIFELKKEKIGLSAFLQAMNYARGIQRYLEKRNKLYLFDIHVSLIGKDIDDSGSFIFLPNVINNDDFSLNYFTYKLDINGLKFHHHLEYSLKNEGF